jgi:hypothetical protein
MLIAPGSFVPEAAMQSKGFIGSMPKTTTVAKLRRASKMRVEVDSIIFADGEVVGPNPLQLIGDINDHHIAADLVVRHVEDAQLRGKNPQDALRELESAPVVWGSRVVMYRSLFIRQLTGTQHFDSVLEHLKGVPVPPKFFRKDGSAL